MGCDFPVVLGWWPDNGLVWLDVTNLVAPPTGGERAAVQLAKARGVLMIFHPVKHEYIRTGRTGRPNVRREAERRAWTEFNRMNLPARIARGHYRTLQQAKKARREMGPYWFMYPNEVSPY